MRRLHGPGRRRLRPPPGRRRLHAGRAGQAGTLVHESHGSNLIGELAGLPASALEDVFASAEQVVSETIHQQAYAQ
jgi:hypothetical protein